MKSRPVPSVTKNRLTALGQIALVVPIATRVLAQVVNPTVHPARKLLAVIVLAEAVIGSIDRMASSGADPSS